MNLTIHVDGASRGNPGPAGAGVVILGDGGVRLHEGAYFLGTQTNNAAEYNALLLALQRALRFGPSRILLRSDSELLVRQLTGQYRVRSASILPLFERAQLLLLKFAAWQIRHVPREQNRRADELANLAVDQRKNVVVLDVDDAAAAAMRASAPPPDAAAPETEPQSQDASGDESDSAPFAAESAAQKPGLSAEPVDPGVGGEASDVAPVRVSVARTPDAGGCPAGGVSSSFVVRAGLPQGLCVYAAHAMLPTLLAIQNTEPHEYSAIPTLTVRCARQGCGATFHLSPVRPMNGHPK